MNELEEILNKAFKKAGFLEKASVQICSLSNLGDFQCNSPLSLAKKYHKKPIDIANEVALNIPQNKIIKEVNAVMPGYINIKIKDEFLMKYILNFVKNIDEKIKKNTIPQKIVVDYGGANAAKPLHVGHLRSANIGESIKRICLYMGNPTLGDVHLGDWGLQMGMIITALEEIQPNLVYFDKNYNGKYPQTPPFSINDLSVLYAKANAKSKEDKAYLEKAQNATFELQNGRKGYVKLWKQILKVSKKDLKKNYDNLNVNFDLWLGESDSKKYYNKIVKYAIKNNYAHLSDGAYVIDVKSEDDKIEVPPFILLKSDGAVLYSTTDLATIVQREKELDADKIIYVVDNRQELHFKQVFRTVEKLKLLNKKIDLEFVGFGTMNGTDNKPFKTRDGKAYSLNKLISDVELKAKEKVIESTHLNNLNIEKTANTVALAALKFADLSVFRTKDYIFDIDKFCSFEGKTGPYILYTIARIKSILAKNKLNETTFSVVLGEEDRDLLLSLIQFDSFVKSAYSLLAPSFLCDYAYKVANSFNTFYAKSNIIYEENIDKKLTKLTLLNCTLSLLEKTLNLLAIKSLDRM